MARLGPFEPAPLLAVAVSGGADSMALALLARDWVVPRGGAALALVVDHGLRPESAAEAAATIRHLGGQGIGARLLRLAGLRRGPGLAARARAARHAALATACAAEGALHLLLGHHAGDQAETLRMRQGAGSGARGLAGMAGLAERGAVRLLRPLLEVPPGRLRALLAACGVAWVEDPSNRDPATLRARLRAELADVAGEGAEVAALGAAARAHGRARRASEREVALELGRRVRLHEAGWALLPAEGLSEGALQAVLCTIAGRRYPVAGAAVAALAGRPRAATLAGVRVMPAGRAGPPGAWLAVREAAAMGQAVPALAGAVWDGRFRLERDVARDMTLGPLGADASRLRRLRPDWPAALLATLPAVRRAGSLVAVPALCYPDSSVSGRFAVSFIPPLPVAGGAFVEAGCGGALAGCGVAVG